MSNRGTFETGDALSFLAALVGVVVLDAVVEFGIADSPVGLFLVVVGLAVLLVQLYR